VTGVLAGTFVGCQAIAYRVGADLPEGLGLDLAAPLAFAGMSANSLRGRPEAAASAVAAAVMVGGAGVLGQAALPSAVLVGVAAGCAASRRRRTVTP
jgi:predicted branched-subunit amino acid permease